jgi:hypothetical protein
MQPVVIGTALEYQAKIAAMSDDELKDAYEGTSGAPGDAWVDALAEALREREIDF